MLSAVQMSVSSTTLKIKDTNLNFNNNLIKPEVWFDYKTNTSSMNYRNPNPNFKLIGNKLISQLTQALCLS